MGLLYGLIVFRVLNGMMVFSYFSPDEFLQSVEVSHKMVFGYGYMYCMLFETLAMLNYNHRTWEWQQESQIRGYAHPTIFALSFWLLERTVEFEPSLQPMSMNRLRI